MKSHKYWSLGAMLCMCMACISGFNMKSKDVHKYWGLGAFFCMLMAVYSGHKMIHRPKKKVSKENSDEK